MLSKRQISEIIRKSNKSILLLGPRQTGKSTLIKSLNPEIEIDLADQQTYLDHLKDPSLIRKKILKQKTVFVDEVQRIPTLLNTVQSLIDHNPSLKFYLTGSSARKLKRGQANLLPGRIHTYNLGPLTFDEAQDPSLEKLLSVGCLPGVYFENDLSQAKKTLRSYVATYLKEEVQAEALTRNLEGFSRFFETLSNRSGDFVDFSKLASLAQIERMSARRYFDIIVDTMIAQPVEAFVKSSKRRLIQHPKFYFFDVGVLNGCLGNFEVSADRKGMLFEHLCLQLMVSEFKARDLDFRISVYRTEAGAEVDFIVECGKETFAVEVKASRTINTSDFRGLKSFSEFYGKKHQRIVIYFGTGKQEVDGIQILPIAEALKVIF